jgi:hypothetical protein
MTEYKVNPKDVFVIRRGGRSGPPPPPEPGLAGWLRRNRFRLSLAVIVIEGVLAWNYHVSGFLLAALAVVFIALYVAYRQRLTSPVVRTVAGILAFSQAILVVVPLFVTLTAILVAGAVVVVILLMLGLGDRSR